MPDKPHMLLPFVGFNRCGRQGGNLTIWKGGMGWRGVGEGQPPNCGMLLAWAAVFVNNLLVVCVVRFLMKGGNATEWGGRRPNDCVNEQPNTGNGMTITYQSAEGQWGHRPLLAAALIQGGCW